MICTFFGHGNCCGFDVSRLQYEIEKLIVKGVDTFYVGNQGYFDRIVFECLLQLKDVYQHLSVSVVLEYISRRN